MKKTLATNGNLNSLISVRPCRARHLVRHSSVGATAGSLGDAWECLRSKRIEGSSGKNNIVLLLTIIILTKSLSAREHVTSYPYISGDTFRSFCTHVIDEDSAKKFNPKNVKNGDTIFIGFNMSNLIKRLEYFFKHKHPKIKARYILITHNSDNSVPGTCARYLNEKKLIAWFALNADYSPPKLIPIPIGLVHRKAASGCGDISVIEELRKDINQLRSKKTHLLYMNFLVNTNPAKRMPVKKFFENLPFCYQAQPQPFAQYMKEMSEFKFVVSPEGKGMDCHRTWEALLLECIPIVKTSPLDKLFKDLPVVIVNDWHEVTEDFLNHEYEKIMQKKSAHAYNMKKLFAPYWFDMIKKAQ